MSGEVGSLKEARSLSSRKPCGSHTSGMPVQWATRARLPEASCPLHSPSSLFPVGAVDSREFNPSPPFTISQLTSLVAFLLSMACFENILACPDTVSHLSRSRDDRRSISLTAAASELAVPLSAYIHLANLSMLHQESVQRLKMDFGCHATRRPRHLTAVIAFFNCT